MISFSVITPSFNSAAYIEETLDSVAALQTPHQHLVMDGGSDDATAQILERRNDPDLTWVSEADRGQTHAVNKGLDRAEGEFIGWLNADDTYLSENVDAALGLLGSNPEIDAVFGFMDIVDGVGDVQRQYTCGRFRWRRYLYFGQYLPTPTIIFRRSLLERAPRLDERFADSADYDFYLRLLRGANVERIRRSLVRFRYQPTSKTASNPALQHEEAMAIRLQYARTAVQRAAMRGATQLLSARNRIISPWPELDED